MSSQAISKTLQLFSLLPRNPREFYERVSSSIGTRWELACTVRPSYRVTPLHTGLRLLEETLGANLADYLHDPMLDELERDLEQNAAGVRGAPFAKHHNGGASLACLCYVLARALRPATVVETGVCYGITSTHLLAALQKNLQGQLHSIDLPPLGKNGDAYVGCLVPEGLHNRWTLHRGTSRRLLPPLAAKLGVIDLFLHDSQHTYENMRAEFATVWPLLPSRGVLVADDVQGNTAFQELMRRRDIALAVVFHEPAKDALFGIAVKR